MKTYNKKRIESLRLKLFESVLWILGYLIVLISLFISYGIKHSIIYLIFSIAIIIAILFEVKGILKYLAIQKQPLQKIVIQDDGIELNENIKFKWDQIIGIEHSRIDKMFNKGKLKIKFTNHIDKTNDRSIDIDTSKYDCGLIELKDDILFHTEGKIEVKVC